MKRTLRHRDDPQRGGPRHVLRPAHAAVLDAVRVIRPGKRAQGVGVDVEDGGDGAVADGVGRDLPARAVGAGDDLPEPRHVHLEEAAVAGLALEVAAHRRGPPDQRAVGEDLHRPDAQPLVAPAGAQAQVEAEAVAVRGGVGQVVQGLRGDHERRPHPEAPLPPRLLPRGHLHRAPGHEAAAHTGLLHAGLQRGGARARRVHGQERPALEDPVHAHGASSSRRHATPDARAAL